MLEEMDLLSLSQNGRDCHIELKEMVKKNPEENEWFKKFKQWREILTEGGGQDE